MEEWIFLDLDGLQFHTVEEHVRYLNLRYEMKSRPEDYLGNPALDGVIKKYRPDLMHLTDTEIYIDVSKNFLQSIDWHKDVQPVEGMSEVVKDLAKKYKLATVTARQNSGRHVIEYLHNKYIPGCMSYIHCAWRFTDEEFKEVSKRDFILNFKKGKNIVFIDDSPKEILRVDDIIPSILFDPSGHHDEKREIKDRIRSWKEIGDLYL